MATTRSSTARSSSTTAKRSSSPRAKSTGTKPAAGERTAGRKSASTKTSSRSTAHRRTSAKSSAVKSTSAKSSAGTARKTGWKTAHGQAWTDKHSENPSSTGKGKAKKEPAKQTSQCWPGYEPVPGKASGTKGSCKPKAHQTGTEKKSDAMAASASKLRKGGK